MITLLGSSRRCCDGITRREALQAGAVPLFGGLSGFSPQVSASTSSQTRRAKAKSVIVLYLLGGAPTQDMFDLKPLAPVFFLIAFF